MPGEDLPNLDQLVDAVAAKLMQKLGRLQFGPAGEPELEIPGWPPGQEVPNLYPRAKLRVQGLELTQSIQHYGTGYGADNSVPIVALKPLVVRAFPYVSADLLEGDKLSGKTVDGELVLMRWGKEVYRTGPTRPAGARVGGESRIDRNLWDEETTIYSAPGKFAAELVRIEWNPTLNFVVPAWYVRAGQTTAIVRLWLTSGEGGVATRSESVQVIPVRAPKVALVRVNWKNPTTNAVTSPSDTDLLNLTGLATRMLPFPYFETTILGVEKTKSGDFSAPAALLGDCNPAWVDLLNALKVTRIFVQLFQLADIVYGVVPKAGALTGGTNTNTGCGWDKDGVGACLVGDELAFAHEVGHLYGCGHVGPGLTGRDLDYPNYGGSLRSIGEVGIDTALETDPLRDPQTNKDLMSYKFPQWVSPYTYRKILDNRDNHDSVAADPKRVRRPILIFTIKVSRFVTGSRAVDGLKAHLVDSPVVPPKPGGQERTPWTIELADANERLLAVHRLTMPVSLGSGCGCCDGTDLDLAPSLDFVEAIAWPDNVARVIVRHDNDAVADLSVGEAPRVEISNPDHSEGKLALKIRAQHPRTVPSVAVLFTADDGQTWEPVAIDPPLDEPLLVDPARLAGGEACRFRAIATAEFQSATADTECFSLPRTARALHIEVAERACEKNRVDLKALVDLRGHEGLAPQEIVWRSDLAGEIGRGYTISVDLEEGRHAISATIPSGIGNSVEERGIIIVGGRPR